MNNCTHENITIDRVCNTCGYDLIVEPQNEKIRQQEQDRIINLLGEHSTFYDGMGDVLCYQCNDSRTYDSHLIAIIKGRN